jgi:hypothetical protein
MSSTRPRATLADYIVVGISPTLIAFLVGSLVFFLVEVLYQGGFEARLNFILALFVMATVCIARISMEEGHAYAATFAAPLALVTGIAMMRFVQISGPLAGLSTLINWGMLALIWWCSHKLTWDCTLLDDSTDASGQGLLQSMGMDLDSEATTSVSNVAPEQPWWQRWFGNDKRPHTPGVWVVWFSLAALPIFGIGQSFLPAGDLASRRYVFKLMVVYVGCGLGLLLTTSFLSIRKYLRQRRLEMPVEMAAAWLGVGAALIGGLLLFSFLLPRPNPEYSIAQLPMRWTTPERGTSRHAVGSDGQKQGSAAQGAKPGEPGSQQGQSKQPQAAQGQSDPKQQGQSQQGQSQQGQSQQGQSQQGQSQQGQSQQGQSQQGQSQQGQSQQGQSQQGQSQQGQSQQGQSQQGQSQQGQSQATQPGERNQSGQKQEGGQQKAGQQEESKQGASQQPQPQSSGQPSSRPTPMTPPSAPASSSPPPPSLPSLTSLVGGLGGLLQMLSYLILGLVIAFFAWKYRHALLEAWCKLLAELRELWEKLFGGSPAPEAAGAPEAAPPPPPRPFAAFADPFASGAARQMTLAQLVRYTFEALEAWARERNCPRHAGQTPYEFAQYLGQLAPVLAGEVAQLADWYGQVAYARHNPPLQAANVLQQLWRRLTAA